MSTGRSSDEALVKACLSGKRRQQKALYDKYKRQLFVLCLRYCSDREEAEDMLQEGFIKVFKDLHQYDPNKGKLISWMYKVVLNTNLENIRKKKRRIQTTDVEYAIETHTDDFDIYDSLSAKELVQLIQTLPDGYRTVFNLYVIEGYAHKEIAEMLDVSVNTSKTQLFKAKQALRDKLEYLLAS